MTATQTLRFLTSTALASAALVAAAALTPISPANAEDRMPTQSTNCADRHSIHLTWKGNAWTRQKYGTSATSSFHLGHAYSMKSDDYIGIKYNGTVYNSADVYDIYDPIKQRNRTIGYVDDSETWVFCSP